jgi:beta-fructofuranosidase
MSDPQRPGYHFLPAANWMNDPNGLIQWGDTYHLFYQYNPNGPTHGSIHWGHATSENLVHWRHEPVALSPDADGPDADGCWSGCAVDADGVPTLIYSGNLDWEQRACVATSPDGLRTWVKHPENPVLSPPLGLDLVAWRDHTVWREPDGWHMLVGSGLRGIGGTVLHYRSADLLTWEERGPLLVGDVHSREPVWTGAMWECPDFFPLGGRHVLLASAWDREPVYSIAFVGRYDGLSLAPDTVQQLDYGGKHFYAPLSFTDRRGRRIVFGWAMEGRGPAAQAAAGWAGVMSLPRELALGRDGRVVMRPVPELQALRGERLARRELTVAPGAPLALPELAGDMLELEVELRPAAGGACGLALRRSPDGAEETVVRYDPAARRLTVERARSSLFPDVESEEHSAPLALEPGEPLRLRVFLDRSILEVFAGDQVAITTRIYPSRPDSLGVALLADGGAEAVVEGWRLRGVWGP